MLQGVIIVAYCFALLCILQTQTEQYWSSYTLFKSVKPKWEMQSFAYNWLS